MATHVALDSDVSRHGLGLEIARGLTSASKGVLTIENRQGGGTLARADFPCRGTSCRTRGGRLSEPVVLVVDDDSSIRDSLSRELRRHGV